MITRRSWGIFLLLLNISIHTRVIFGAFPRILECDFYDPELCDGDKPDPRCDLGTNCDPAQDRPAFCMVQWTNVNNTNKVSKKGCWGEDHRCIGRSGCYEDRINTQDYFCCCEGNRCNEDFRYTPMRQANETDDDYLVHTVCEYYDTLECREDTSVCNKKSIVCDKPDLYGKPVHCYAVWNNTSGQYKIIKKGCWLDHDECRQSSCLEMREPDANKWRFCCCTGSMCNVDLEPRSSLQPEVKDTYITSEPVSKKQGIKEVVAFSLVPLLALALIIFLGYWFWRKKISLTHEPLPTIETGLDTPPNPPVVLRSIQLLEIKARGRFGCVWKANMLTEVVAVKIFPIQDLVSFATERNIYELPHISSHENILHFIAAEKRGDHLNMGLWLITEYHANGSLYDYLKGNLITFEDVLRITESMTNGLAFLHAEICSPSYKPTVVHRDFKSKNVLIRRDKTACIADFGLALMFHPSLPMADTHGQVGTRRYMAPEVLEGAINFSRDNFLRIDMYACALVMWEIMTRCSSVDGPVEEYRLPFEDSVGQHPTLEDMQEEVVSKKSRPPFKPQWALHSGLMVMYHTIVECWDQDPEARLTAACTHERMMEIVNTPTSVHLPLVLTATNTQPPATWNPAPVL